MTSDLTSSSDLTPKVRLVKCPKCRNVLPEVADVPIYKCGGCGVILRAKRRQNATSTRSDSQEPSAAQGNGLNHVSEDDESNSSNLKAQLCSVEHSSERSDCSDLDKDLSCNAQQLGVVNMPDKVEENESNSSHLKAQLRSVENSSERSDCSALDRDLSRNGQQLGVVNMPDKDEENESNSSNLKAQLCSVEHSSKESGCSGLDKDLSRNGRQLGVVNMPDKDEENEPNSSNVKAQSCSVEHSSEQSECSALDKDLSRNGRQLGVTGMPDKDEENESYSSNLKAQLCSVEHSSERSDCSTLDKDLSRNALQLGVVNMPDKDEENESNSLHLKAQLRSVENSSERSDCSALDKDLSRNGRQLGVASMPDKDEENESYSSNLKAQLCSVEHSSKQSGCSGLDKDLSRNGQQLGVVNMPDKDEENESNSSNVKAQSCSVEHSSEQSDCSALDKDLSRNGRQLGVASMPDKDEENESYSSNLKAQLCSVEHSSERSDCSTRDKDLSRNGQQLGVVNMPDKKEENESNSSNLKAQLCFVEHSSEQSECSALDKDLSRNGRQLGVVNMPDKNEETDGSNESKHEEIVCEEPVVLSPPNKDQKGDGTDGNTSESFDGEHPGGSSLSIEDVKKENDQNESQKWTVECQEFSNEQPRIVNRLSEDKASDCDQNTSGDHDGELQGDSDKQQPEVMHLLIRDTDGGTNQSEPEVCDGEQLGDLNGGGNGSDPNDSGDCNTERPVFAYESTSQSEPADCENDESLSAVGGNLEAPRDNESAPLASGKSETDVRGESYFASRKMVTDSPQATWEVSSHVSVHREAGRSISSDSLTSSPCEQEQFQKTARASDHSRPIDTLETAGYGSQSSELSQNLGDLPKSSTITSSCAYDGSVSSYDGTESCFPNKHSRPPKNANETARFFRSNGRPKKGKQLIETTRYRNAELQGLARKSISISSDGKPHTLEKLSLDHVEYLEPKRHVHPVRNWKRSESEHYPYAVPFNPKGTLEGYEAAGPSNGLRRDFQDNSSYHSTKRPTGAESERLELLRIVYELQDKLNRAQHLKGTSDGAISTELPWAGKNFPIYHNQEAGGGDIFNDFGHLRYPGRYIGESRMAKEQRLSQIPFFEGLTYHGVHADHSYHCFPHDLRYSAPLPPHIPHENNGFSGVHPGWNSVYGSGCSSAWHYVDSRLPLRNGEVNFDDKMHEYHAMKIHLKEKNYSDKQHYLPTAGAAPFITCYRCLNLLQLPPDFLLIKRRYHRLKCGYCSEVLKFSLQNRVHITPYLGIRPSEVDGFSDTASGKNLVSTSYGDDGPQLDPVSCSDDIGDSFFKSCSTEGDGYPTESQSSQGDAYGRMLSRNSSLQHVREQGEKQFRNKQKNEGETSAASSLSPSQLKPEKTFSKAKELPASSNSPLHRLMGYSSPQDLIDGSDPVGGGRSSSSASGD